MAPHHKNASQLPRGAAVLALFVLLALAACDKGGDEVRKYDELSASNFNLGISFGQSRNDAKAALGTPDGVVERQAGRNVDEWYKPDFSRQDTAAPGTKDTHLALSYLDDQLIRVYARYNPGTDHPDMPPFMPEPLPGLKLGVTRQQFDQVLGTPKEEQPQPKWVFANKDGSQVMLLAEFADPNVIPGEEPKTGPADVVCVSLTVAHAGPAPQSRGEEFEKSEERKKRLKGEY